MDQGRVRGLKRSSSELNFQEDLGSGVLFRSNDVRISNESARIAE